MSKVCRLCGNGKFQKVINFGRTPLVNSLLKKEECGTEKTYPLLVEQCEQCFLVQIVNPISTHQIYQAQDYLYYTGDMPTTDAYFGEFAEELSKYVSEDGLVVEIGSNDGTMLSHFESRKLGVDPSTNVVIRALSRGVPTLSAEFNERNAQNIAKEFGKAKIIGGANCIAHLNDLHSLLKGVKALLADDGVFWVECNYWGGMVKNKNYSLIYHDHYSYFSLKNWVDLAAEYGLTVFDAYVTPAQGGSLRIFMSATEKEWTDRYTSLLKKELETNLNSHETAKKYAKECKKEAKKLKKTVEEIKRNGKTIAGYGAAAKGFSVLHLAQITGEEIDYFVDDSPAKQNLYTPVTHIPVISRKEAEVKLPDYFFITAPNYEAVIVEKEKAKGFNGKFLTCDSRVI